MLVAWCDQDDLDDLYKLGYHESMPPHADQYENHGDPCAQLDSTDKLTTLFADYGQDWQIQRQISPTAWVAVRRCTPPVLEVHCALSIDDLRAKLDRAEPGQ